MNVFLALREIRHAKARFGLLMAAIALLVFLILTQQALQSGLITSFVGAIERQSAPVLVYSVDGQRTLQGSVITPPLERTIAAVPGVADAGRIGQGTFTVSVGRGRPVGRGADRVFVSRGSGGPTRSAQGECRGPPERRWEARATSRSVTG